MLGDRWDDGEQEYIGLVFFESGIERVRIPSTLKVLEEGTFHSCKNLKNVEARQGLECIEKDCFACSGLERITLPKSLTEISKSTFSACKDLRTIYVEDGCNARFADVEISASVELIFLQANVFQNNVFNDSQ